jgi:hypothetical protein
LSFRDSDPGLGVFSIVAGVAVLTVSLVTDEESATSATGRRRRPSPDRHVPRRFGAPGPR